MIKRFNEKQEKDACLLQKCIQQMIDMIHNNPHKGV